MILLLRNIYKYRIFSWSLLKGEREKIKGKYYIFIIRIIMAWLLSASVIIYFMNLWLYALQVGSYLTFQHCFSLALGLNECTMNQRLKFRSQYFYTADKSYHCESNSLTPEIVWGIIFYGQYHPLWKRNSSIDWVLYWYLEFIRASYP